MPKVYDDWERLVGATLRKQELWELFHDHSRTPSDGSTASATSTTTPISPSASASPLNRIAEVVPTARVSPLTNSTTRFKSGAINEEHGNNGFVEEEKKKMMRRSKSRMRLDRWILTRWLSKTFHSTSP